MKITVDVEWTDPDLKKLLGVLDGTVNVNVGSEGGTTNPEPEPEP